LVRSCNTAFAQLVATVGENDLRTQAQLFGIGRQDVTIPILVTPSTLGDIPDVPALQQSGIGQRDVALTPLQNAMIAATIANGGLRMKPQMVRNILAPDLSVLDGFAPELAETPHRTPGMWPLRPPTTRRWRSRWWSRTGEIGPSRQPVGPGPRRSVERSSARPCREVADDCAHYGAHPRERQ
jgi:hypothetical protein